MALSRKEATKELRESLGTAMAKRATPSSGERKKLWARIDKLVEAHTWGETDDECDLSLVVLLSAISLQLQNHPKVKHFCVGSCFIESFASSLIEMLNAHVDVEEEMNIPHASNN